ncbi:glycosyltransferase [Sphingomonas ginkgonis]|uniref:Glycosyltransferase n=1 Tax=Sphingomonas ginkgonis TaxID=2315330 RepID=A0A429V7W1_9SPHN|nr:glycosyltransferase [Sphingomonas ginkgonis]RST30051.1 glycosyltransferase [Sphingomonas ginkgonis]
MRIVDVCAFYSPQGGGVRTYVERKWAAMTALGHEMIVLAPGERDEVVERAPGAILATIAAPKLVLDRRYRYFSDEAALHRALDRWQPDFVEASSPWSSASMVNRWQGAAPRSLVMHADPLASYAYRWFGRVAKRDTIDRGFSWFWRHLRQLDQGTNLVVSASAGLSRRLSAGGLAKIATIPMGVEPGVFSPLRRDSALRAELLAGCGLDERAMLLVGAGRLASEKRWPMVIRAVAEASQDRPIGLVIAGGGREETRVRRATRGLPNVRLLGRLEGRGEFARLLASGDALVHGCESETFCMAAAEARASGLPLIVPDAGGAYDQLLPGAGRAYRAGDMRSLAWAIRRFADHGFVRQHAVATEGARVRTMDEHFAELSRRYEALAGVAERPFLQAA